MKIPQNWALSTIGEVCTQPQYGYTTSGVDSGNLRLLRTTDITKGDIDWETVPFCHENPADEEKYLLKDGDIVISRAGSIGVSHLIKNPQKSVFASYLIRFRPFVTLAYFKYFLDSPFYWQQISENRLGIAVPNVNATKLQTIAIPLPPTNEQKRIVAKIEELFSELDKGIETFKTVREQLKVYRQAVLKSALEQRGGRKTTLGELLSYITSGSRGWAEYYSDSGELFIRAQNLKYDRLDLAECAYVSIPNKTEGTRTKVQLGDLLITITGANVTKSALVEQDLGTAYVSQHVALCRPIKEVFPKFLYWFIIAEAAGRKQLSSAAYGAGKPGLNLDNIKSVQVTIPSYDQQVAVVKIIEEKLSVCEELEQEIEANLQKSEALRQSILKKAFSGNLVAQDSNDEPARVLLERIRAEKEAQKTEHKPKAKRNAA